jgi:hypothetical protein
MNILHFLLLFFILLCRYSDRVWYVRICTSIVVLQDLATYDEVYSIQRYVIKFVSDSLQVCNFHQYFWETTTHLWWCSRVSNSLYSRDHQALQPMITWTHGENTKLLYRYWVKKNIIIYKYELSDFVILAFLTPNLSNDVTLTSLGTDHRCFGTLGKETYKLDGL